MEISAAGSGTETQARKGGLAGRGDARPSVGFGSLCSYPWAVRLPPDDRAGLADLCGRQPSMLLFMLLFTLLWLSLENGTAIPMGVVNVRIRVGCRSVAECRG